MTRRGPLGRRATSAHGSGRHGLWLPLCCPPPSRLILEASGSSSSIVSRLGVIRSPATAALPRARGCWSPIFRQLGPVHTASPAFWRQYGSVVFLLPAGLSHQKKKNTNKKILQKGGVRWCALTSVLSTGMDENNAWASVCEFLRRFLSGYIWLFF